MRVTVLGPLTVADGDGVVLPAGELPRRARQVLAVLSARHDRIQSKDALADAVWGNDLPGNHVATLEHYVSMIRRRLQPGSNAASWFIVTRGSGYLFDTGRAELDLAELRTRIRGLDDLPPEGSERLAAHGQILALARQLPFPEDPYADWAEPARTEVQFAAVNALLALAAAALPDDPARSLRLAQEAVGLSPFLESGYQAAMSAAVAMDRPDEALRIFDRCRRVLNEELGVPPSAELVRLQAAALAHRLPRPAEAQPAPTPPPTEPAVSARPATPQTSELDRAAVALGGFVGRQPLLDVLFEPAAPLMMHVVGPVGAGKSAFLTELARRAPGRVGIGHAGSLAGVFRLAWLRAALIDLGAGPDVLAAVDGARPDRALGPEDLELIGTVFDRPERVFLAVDDAADLDAAGVAELAWLSRHCPQLRVVLTYRYPSQVVDRPLAALDTAVVLRLGPLTHAELAPLGDERVAERSGGIPALVPVATRPPEIACAVAMQIARQRTRWMREPAWDVLRLCAVLGPLSAADLAPLTGRPVPEVLTAIDDLVHAHLLSDGPGGTVQHRSSLVRDAIREQVSQASSAHLREKLAAAS
ncbi:DNA-binding SARP family transcriptional activator [Krasilnikovia cinnamomea]|uniref:DNA-binding SARP family transcriptional activator n=2 Tax=Krasilnikovia cinnamomea TaxID=349313 RepID=A0A4Q7ZF86_9ACTN|nr:DNA-binding SARP family transcriptional activator [Krasilnikovia cinnamomea]